MLLVAVLVIWGLIGYKIISAMNPEQPEIQQKMSLVSFKPNTTTELDTFSIQPVYRDPFLGTLAQKHTTTTKHTTTPPVQWPQITYGGLVKKQNTTTQIFVLNINNNQYLLKKGQSVADVTLLKGNPNGVVVRYKNQSKTIDLQ